MRLGERGEWGENYYPNENMGLNGFGWETKTREQEQAEKQVHEIIFTGTETEIFDQIELFKKESGGKIVTSYEMVRITKTSRGDVYTLRVTFDDNRNIKHSSSDWIPELTKEQAS